MQEFEEQKENSALQTIFKDGKQSNEQSLEDIRYYIDLELDNKLGTNVLQNQVQTSTD